MQRRREMYVNVNDILMCGYLVWVCVCAGVPQAGQGAAHQTFGYG